ncbi:hypothetical protein ACIBI3_38860 [Actinomadura luteofluorescens]|uniref:hypothetical protein n=1 Tax=Actinomadura luteofluorescens TaxID=46163 RepID=UPI0034860D70
MASELTAKHRRLKPNDITMSVFLHYGCSEGMLVDTSTDVHALRAQLSKGIKQDNIRFPYVFGRDLHDAAATLFPEKTQLDNNQTIELLKRLPDGVFQVGRTVVGPYGCTISDVSRLLPPMLRVPGYLCSDETCQEVHSIELKTAHSSINKTNTIVAEYIRSHYSNTEDEHVNVISEAALVEYFPQDDAVSTNFMDVLSDGFSETELRFIVDRILRTAFKVAGRRNDITRRLEAAIANPTDFVASIDRARLLQIALLFSDRAITRAIDESIDQGDVVITDFEVRVSRVRRWDPEYDERRVEIGQLGVRYTGPTTASIARQTQKVLHEIYYKSGQLEPADLAYILDAPRDTNEGELLGRRLVGYSPRELVSKLIVPSRSAAMIAAERLCVVGYEDMPREELLERLCWKIGTPTFGVFSDLRKLEEHAAKFHEVNDGTSSVDALRAVAINLCTALEDTLSRSLIYSTWAFSVDHYLTAEGFIYDPLLSASVLEFIETNCAAESPEIVLKLDGRITLAALGAGFARLAKSLKSLDPEEWKRPEQQIPPVCKVTDRPFAFPSRVPFFNLTTTARAEVISALQHVSRLMQHKDVIDFRNATAHGNRDFPERDKTRTVLHQIAQLSAHFRDTGLYPHLFEFKTSTRDAIGREVLIYEDGNQQIELHRPGWAIAPRLPSFGSRIICIPVAETATSGPLRFGLKSKPGKDPYWDGWPKRWRIQSNYGLTGDPISSAGEDVQTA